ncbi:MAG TPA: chemotaxis protein CheW [bacterium]|nr:chemotaxis protein CheW [bacterium]
MEINFFQNNNGENSEQIEEQFNMQSVLWFSLGSEDYAIKVDNVQTVLDQMVLTPIPNTPRFVMGVINLRGLIFPIVDLKELFQMPREEKKDRMAVVLEIDDMRVGIAVDKVKEVLDIDFAALQPPPPSLSGLGTEYVLGIHKISNNILIVIDIAKVISIASEMINKYA